MKRLPKGFILIKICKTVAAAGILSVGLVSGTYAQQEDTTRTEERELDLREYRIEPRTPYQMDISRFNENQYHLFDHEGTYSFYNRLRYLRPEDILLSEEERYEPYGPDWERQINEQLAALLEATFPKQSGVLGILARIAPFLGFGFFEPYSVPIAPRNENPDLVPVDH